VIVFEAAPQPAVRAGEEEIGGRRAAGRLLPYGAEPEAGILRFDPLARRFPLRREETVVAVGPPSVEAWREAALRLPPGPVLVGPGPLGSVEEFRGAYRAAAEGALAAGRAVYLLDPPAAGIPRELAAGMVALCSFAAGLSAESAAFPSLAPARARGLVCGVLFPLIPGWTAEPAAIEAIVGEAAAGGARAATPLVPDADGESRRAIVEARAFTRGAGHGDGADEDADAFFEAIHHREWVDGMVARLPAVRSRCAARGLGLLPPRPTGPLEPSGNAAASARLEERAELDALPEHRAALLRAAVRWIDESGRDLAAVAREGNFRRVFPFDGEVAAEAEAALRPAL
jgi:hypothetical protein